jgi:feruloyl esterase
MTVVVAQGACESLVSLVLPHTSITSAAVVPEGPLGGGRAGGPAPIVVPARCVVKAVTKPSSDSEIRFEVWMPVSGWNGKYQQAGNGGWAGSIPTASLVAGVMRGYATAGTDDGHADGLWADWAIGHPEKLVDFGHRAVHETSVQAKAIVAAFYKRDPSKSYFVGCSDGGREALMEAQRFPDDFHGIIAGAPANNWTGLMTMALTIEGALDEASLPASKLPAIQAAALNACDNLDAVKDGLIEDPRACTFDPAVLTCKGPETDQCLTAPQVITLRKIYDGPRHPRTGIFRSHRALCRGPRRSRVAGCRGSRRHHQALKRKSPHRSSPDSAIRFTVRLSLKIPGTSASGTSSLTTPSRSRRLAGFSIR